MVRAFSFSDYLVKCSCEFTIISNRIPKMNYCVFINVVLLLLQLCSAETKKEIIDSVKTVDEINNNPDLPWQADTYGFKEIDVAAFRRDKLGLKLPSHEPLAEKDPKELIALATVPADEKDRLGLPVNFTWLNRDNTKCPIHHIRDQSNCGSCWAVSTASALGDRFCIQSKLKIHQNFSQEFVTSCSTENYGCWGGYMDRVNQFMTKVGTITGGDYESDEGCQMYTIQPCGFPVTHRMPCDYRTAITPKCKRRRCNNDWWKHRVEPDEHVYKAKSWYMVRSNITHSREDRAREELFRNGPLTAGFLVPHDFIYYKKGVYVPPRRAWIVGGHAVRVVGYGIENGLKYWHVANSWSTMWGERGFFKILRGVNVLMFENWLSALEPKLP